MTDIVMLDAGPLRKTHRTIRPGATLARNRRSGGSEAVTHRKKPLQAFLPLRAINEASAREPSVRHRDSRRSEAELVRRLFASN